MLKEQPEERVQSMEIVRIELARIYKQHAQESLTKSEESNITLDFLPEKIPKTSIRFRNFLRSLRRRFL